MKKIKTNVLVAGGGTSGVFAAIAAAMNGVEVMIIEKNSILGGTMTSGGVNFPGLFYAWGKQIISGPCMEAIERAEKLGGAMIPKIQYKPEHHWKEQILLNNFIYTAVLFEMCEKHNIRILTNAMFSVVEENEDGVKAYVTTKNEIVCIEADKIIDATGDANVIQLLGYKVNKSEICQPATPQTRLAGYDMENIDLNMLREQFAKEDFPKYFNADSVIGWLRGNKINIHIPCKDADSSFGKTELEKSSYSMLLKVYEFLRKIRGLENLYVDYIAFETGVRETNRIIGEYAITSEEYINGTEYDDSICYSFYPIDLHIMTGIKQEFHKDGVVSKIPYRALLPKGGRHIISAGRCISSDALANSAIRTQATCMATGQAAGCAAAIACLQHKKMNEVDIEALKASLCDIGAIVP